MYEQISAVVVVYNKKCSDSITCRNLAQMTNIPIRVIIYDNSTKDFGNRDYCEQKGWVYLGGSGNVGLSKAYNASISYLKQSKQNKYVCLFDDDTDIKQDYFVLLCDTIEHSNNKIYVPLIYAKSKLISPCVLNSNYGVKLFKSVLDAVSYNGPSLSAINSCMALDLSLFDNFSYDENIFLDGIDHYFLFLMKQRGERITVFQYRCDHEFSGVSKPSKKTALVRFSIFVKDYHYIMRKKFFGYLVLLLRRTAHLTLQYRSLSFIKILFQLSCKRGKELL